MKVEVWEHIKRITCAIFVISKVVLLESGEYFTHHFAKFGGTQFSSTPLIFYNPVSYYENTIGVFHFHRAFFLHDNFMSL